MREENWGPTLSWPLAEGSTAPTVLGAQQAVEDLFHHDGIQFDELWQGLDHFFL